MLATSPNRSSTPMTPAPLGPSFADAMGRIASQLESMVDNFISLRRREDYEAILALPQDSPLREFYVRHQGMSSFGQSKLSRTDRAMRQEYINEALRRKRAEEESKKVS